MKLNAKEMKLDTLLILLFYTIASIVSYFVTRVTGYKHLADTLLICLVGILIVCIYLALNDKYVYKAYHLWKVIFINLSIFIMYTACTLSILRPSKENIIAVVLLIYIIVELLLIISRIFIRSEKYVNSLIKNKYSDYIKIDTVLSIIFIELVLFTIKYTDSGLLYLFKNIKAFIVLLIFPSLTIAGAVICVHVIARYRFLNMRSK